MPLVDLLHGTAESRLNLLLGKWEMAFDVLMWSVEARETVYHHLKNDLGKSSPD